MIRRRSPALTDTAFVAFLVSAAVVLLIWSRERRRTPWTEILLVGLAVGFALLYVRTIAVGAAIVAPVTALSLARVVGLPREPLARREVALTLGLTASALAVGPDGKLTVAGSAAGVFMLSRHLDVVPDVTVASFDPNGSEAGPSRLSFMVLRDRYLTIPTRVYFSVGGTPQAAFEAARAGGPPVPSHHSPLFRIDPEPSIRLGTEAMTVAVLDLLGPAASASGN